MIAKGSVRGGGADIATHLSNAHDNECVEVHEIRGSVADDLHGAFSEWEAQAHAMTRTKKGFYSLIVSPDEKQGRWSREQYLEFIDRAGKSLGLTDQGRAIVFHIKEGEDGELREHCHVVWSRTDIQECKAIDINFDRYKLMNVSRSFALDHNLKMPSGYENWHSGENDPLTLHEKAMQDLTGIAKEERQQHITGLWQRSDSPSAFVAALSDSGYILTQGKRPYALVDYYGQVNSLPRMIDDKHVRLAEVKRFLGEEFPNDRLPSVEEAKALAKKQREEHKLLAKKEEHAEQREILREGQEQRAAKLKAEVAEKEEARRVDREAFERSAEDRHTALRQQHDGQDFEVQIKRWENNPEGLSAFLSKVSGASFIRKKLQEREDRKRADAQHQEKEALARRIHDERQSLHILQNTQMRELHRQQKAQELTFARERSSLKKAQSRELAAHYRKGHQHMPSAALTLTPSGRMAQPARAQNRHAMQTAKELNVKAKGEHEAEKLMSLSQDFADTARKLERDQGGRRPNLPDQGREKGRKR
ncbi:MAG: relaxase [Pseudomonadota bacterium]